METTLAGTGLKSNRKKTELMKIDIKANSSFTDSRESIREVVFFVYLESVVDRQWGTDKDVTARKHGKIRWAVVVRKDVWASRHQRKDKNSHL
jgi:hypothetical protein